MSAKTFILFLAVALSWRVALTAPVAEEDETASGTTSPSAEPAAQGPVVVGELPEGRIVSLFVSPTRADSPYAASERKAYTFESDTSRWRTIYEAKAEDAGILAIAGYAKSSKPLYLVHGSGVAVSHDAGSTWEESIPPDYAAGNALLGIAVNPTERRECVFATDKGSWITRDYGKTWMPFDAPNPVEPIVGLAYSGADKPVLVVASRQALYVSDEKLERWTTLMRRLDGPVALAPSGTTSLAVFYDATKHLTAFDLARPGYRLSRPADLPQNPNALALDSEGRGGVWLQTTHQIYFVNLQESEPPTVKAHLSMQEIRNLTSHPRKMDTIFWTEGPRLYRMDNAFTASGGVIGAGIPESDFAKTAPVETESGVQVAGNSAAVEKQAQAILDELMASSPPLEEVIAAALEFATYKPKEAEEWRKNVRRKNLVPELRIGAGAQEGTVNQYGLLTNRDRFGVDSTTDYHSDDDTRYMNEYWVELRWQLSGLVFSREQLYVSEEARQRAAQRNTLITQVTELYYRRLELLVQKRVNADRLSLEESLSLRIRLDQMTELLNGICGEPLFDSKH